MSGDGLESWLVTEGFRRYGKAMADAVRVVRRRGRCLRGIAPAVMREGCVDKGSRRRSGEESAKRREAIRPTRDVHRGTVRRAGRNNNASIVIVESMASEAARIWRAQSVLEGAHKVVTKGQWKSCAS